MGWFLRSLPTQPFCGSMTFFSNAAVHFCCHRSWYFSRSAQQPLTVFIQLSPFYQRAGDAKLLFGQGKKQATCWSLFCRCWQSCPAPACQMCAIRLALDYAQYSTITPWHSLLVLPQVLVLSRGLLTSLAVPLVMRGLVMLPSTEGVLCSTACSSYWRYCPLTV